MKRILEYLEYLGGARDEPPAGSRWNLGSRLWSVWWLLLCVLILFFSGQSSKFIYIDF